MVVYLKDYREVVKEEFLKRNSTGNYYSAELFEKAFKIETDKNLRYNMTNGKTYDNYFGLV